MKSENENFTKKCEKNILVGKKILFLKEMDVHQEKKSEIKDVLLSLIQEDDTQETDFKDNMKSEIVSLLYYDKNELKIPEYLNCQISFVIEFVVFSFKNLIKRI